MFAAGAGSSLRPLAVVHTRGTPATRGRLGAWSPCCTAAVDWLAAGAPWNQVCCHGRDLIGWGARPRSSTPRDALVKHGGRRATGRQCVRCSAAARVGVRTCSSVTSLHFMHAMLACTQFAFVTVQPSALVGTPRATAAVTVASTESGIVAASQQQPMAAAGAAALAPAQPVRCRARTPCRPTTLAASAAGPGCLTLP